MTRHRRWSERLEGQRGGAEAAAREAASQLDQAEAKIAAAKTVVLNNPDLAQGYLADAIALIAQAGRRQERIIRLMGEARHGLTDSE